VIPLTLECSRTDEALLEANNVSKEYKLRGGFLEELLDPSKRGIVQAVTNVNMRIRKGEIMALVGESGCGKTTFGKLVSKLEEVSSGRILFAGRDVTVLSRRDTKRFRREVQIILQDPFGAVDPRYTVEQAVTEPLNVHKIGTWSERREKVRAALAMVGLTPPEEFLPRYQNELSGGQRQRVSLARALIFEPRLIVADEPTSMLDASIRSGVINQMLELKERLGMAYLFITHDLAVARHMGDRIAVMYLGSVVETGDVATVVRHPIHPYTRALFSAVPDVTTQQAKRRRVRLEGEVQNIIKSATERGCVFYPRCPLARLVDIKSRELCRQEKPSLTVRDNDRLVACHHR